MEAKNKAIELVEKFGNLATDVVDEILKEHWLPNVRRLTWGRMVRQEIIDLKQQKDESS